MLHPAHIFSPIYERYSHWIKKDKAQIQIIGDRLSDNEAELEAHPEFDEVHPDDLAALASFRESLGIKNSRVALKQLSAATPSSHDHHSVADVGTTPSPATIMSSKRRFSTSSSQRSKISGQSSLSPLYEEDVAVGDDNSPSPQKRRRLMSHQGRGNSLGSSVTMSTIGKAQSRIDEVDENDDESVSDRESN